MLHLRLTRHPEQAEAAGTGSDAVEPGRIGWSASKGRRRAGFRLPPLRSPADSTLRSLNLTDCSDRFIAARNGAPRHGRLSVTNSSQDNKIPIVSSKDQQE